MADSTTTVFINLHQTDEKYIHWPLTHNPIILHLVTSPLLQKKGIDLLKIFEINFRISSTYTLI